jgi:hypothetical protein
MANNLMPKDKIKKKINFLQKKNIEKRNLNQLD